MFNYYIEMAKKYMKEDDWKLAMFYLGQAQLYAGAKVTNAFTLEEKLEIIDDLVQMCFSETKPA